MYFTIFSTQPTESTQAILPPNNTLIAVPGGHCSHFSLHFLSNRILGGGQLGLSEHSLNISVANGKGGASSQTVAQFQLYSVLRF